MFILSTSSQQHRKFNLYLPRVKVQRRHHGGTAQHKSSPRTARRPQPLFMLSHGQQTCSHSTGKRPEGHPFFGSCNADHQTLRA